MGTPWRSRARLPARWHAARRARCRGRWGWAWRAVLLALASAASAQPRTAPEAELQAVFLINFARLTEWPAQRLEAGVPLQLCVDAGHEALLAALRRMGMEMVQGRPLLLRELPRGEAARECHLLFVEPADLRRTGPGQLSVGDAPGFAAAGGVIGLVRVDNRLRFEVNREAAQRAQLRLSSELLKLALVPGEGRSP